MLAMALPAQAGAAATPSRRILFAAGDSIFSVRPDGDGYRKLASGSTSFAPVWSPNKQHIAFTRHEGSVGSVWVMKADGSDERVLAENGDSPSWSPDGDRLVYVRRAGVTDPFATGDALVTVAIDGTQESVVAEAEGRLESPQWSPDGAEIAFVAGMPTDDGDPTTFDEDNLDIYKVVLETEEIVRLTEDLHRDEDPRWSPDGNRLAFVSDRDDERCGEGSDGCPYTTEIYLMEPDGSSEKRFTHNALHHDRNPEWAPDGRALVWNRTTDDDVNTSCCNAEIVLKAVDGSRSRLLTKDDRFDLDPSFSPGGFWVVFMSYREGGLPDLYKMRIDGSDRARITSTGRAESAPDW
ncbi:MAG TPA: hypothetical protein VJ927_03880 [Actinomycetota bacterium]|nr:hypothetical protein [Actinomycetota bacterium]